jgi:integrase
VTAATERKSVGARQRLTDAIVRRLATPERGKAITVDSEAAGFGARVTANGARSYVLRYTTRAGRERTFTIGDATVWRCTDARDKARELRRKIEDGGDPLADIEADREAPTVADLIERFREEHLPRKRPSTRADYERMLRLHIGPHFGQHTKVADVRFEDIDALHRKITKAGSTYAANRCIAVLSKMFSLAIRWRMRSDNPCRGIEKNPESKRKRYLSADELARLTTALAKYPDKQAADIVRLLLLTGARRGEVLAMRWADIDPTGTWTKPGSTTKQRTDHVVPLSAPVRQLLADIEERYAREHPKKPLPEYVFPGAGDTGHVVEIKKPWRHICKAAGITGLRVHDLRHSFASQLASAGSSLTLIGTLLGHANPTTTHRYAHLFDDPQRAAVERVGAAIINAGKAEPAPPVRLKRRGRS